MAVRELSSSLFYHARVIEWREKGDRLPRSSVHFRPRRSFFDQAELLSIETDDSWRGHGYGGQLIHQFIKRVGFGDVVTTGIAHAKTWPVLRRLELLRSAYEAGRCDVTDSQVLCQEIPITRYLNGNGIVILRLEITFDRSKQASSYEKIEAVCDRGKAHFIQYFSTRMIGEI